MNIYWHFHSKYDKSEVKKYVPTDAGIYLLWVKLKNGDWKCFYVGKADNLEERLLEHLSEKEKNECIKNNLSKYFCGFDYAKVARQSDRNGIEKYLYDYYKQPECNEVDPGGKPVEVNLP